MSNQTERERLHRVHKMTNATARGRATTVELDALHGMLAKVFADYLQRCIAREQIAEPSMLSQVVKWLSANNVDVPARAAGVDRLLGQVPNMDELEMGLVVPRTSRLPTLPSG